MSQNVDMSRACREISCLAVRKKDMKGMGALALLSFAVRWKAVRCGHSPSKAKGEEAHHDNGGQRSFSGQRAAATQSLCECDSHCHLHKSTWLQKSEKLSNR